MRIGRDEWGLRLAEVTALRGTCLRRQVGCVLVDIDGHVLATGYNGVPKGEPHCNDVTWHDPSMSGGLEFVQFRHLNACPGAHKPSGTGLTECEAVHAEMNAISQCRDVRLVNTVYVTASPCADCVKALMNTGAKRVVFREPYPHTVARDRWLRNGTREWVHLPRE